MEKPLLPAWLTYCYWAGAKKKLYIPIVIPSGSQAMDVYNALLLLKDIETEQKHHGWITTKGRYISGEEAAKMAIEANLLDKRTDRLTLQDYQGAWKP